MIVRDLGAGLAPDVRVRDGLINVALPMPTSTELLTYRPDGTLVATRTLHDASYPRFGGDWLAFKLAPAFVPAALNLRTQELRTFAGVVGGDPGVVISDDTLELVWQTLEGVGDGRAYRVWAAPFAEGIDAFARNLGLVGAPDGLEALTAAGRVICRKDIGHVFTDVGSFAQRRGDLRCGQFGYGIGVRVDGWSAARWLLGDAVGRSDTKDPRADTDGADVNAFVSWGNRGVRLVLATRTDLLALPLTPTEVPVPVPPDPIPTFAFTHRVIVAPFKDPDGSSGATHEISVDKTGMTMPRPHFAAGDSLDGTKGERLGLYSESSSDPGDDLVHASKLKTRLLLLKDGPGAWGIPGGLRHWDIPARELFLVAGETLAATVTRWENEVRTALVQWPGDLCVAPMFYCQGGAPPNELWPVGDVLRGLAHVSHIVNLSPRIKLLAPFAYDRANGIRAHAELQQALANLIAAAKAAGLAALTPIPPDPVPVPPDPIPPTPPPVTTSFTEGDLLMVFSKFTDPAAKGLIPVKAVKPVAGTSLFTLILPDNRVYSMQPDGSDGDRDPGADGGYERCRVAGNVATFKPVDQFFTRGFVIVDGL